MSVLRFNPWPPADLRAFTLAHDLVLVPGGNTANMLAVWRVHGFDAVLREAWEAGVVLWGWSAGMICSMSSTQRKSAPSPDSAKRSSTSLRIMSRSGCQ